MPQDWYIYREGMQTGPFNLEQLIQLARGGELSRADLVWNSDLQDWIRADLAAGLFPAEDGAAPPLPATASPVKSGGAASAEVAIYRKKSRAWAWIFFFLIVPVVFVVIWRSMGELNADVFYSLGGFIAVTGVLAYFTTRAANKSWKGTLVDKYVKDVRVKEGDGHYHYKKKYILLFQTDQKRRERVVITPGGYEYFHKGDRAMKVKGLHYPEKILRDGLQQICLTCGSVYDLNKEQCPRCRFQRVDIKAVALEQTGSL